MQRCLTGDGYGVSVLTVNTCTERKKYSALGTEDSVKEGLK